MEGLDLIWNITNFTFKWREDDLEVDVLFIVQAPISGSSSGSDEIKVDSYSSNKKEDAPLQQCTMFFFFKSVRMC